MAVIGYSIAGYLILRLMHWDPNILFPPCRLYARTGYYCIGCGGTRALRLFFQGRWLRSFYYHPAVDVVMLFLCVFLPTNTLDIMTKGRIHGLRIQARHLWILAGIMVMQWIIKNGVYYFTGVHLI